MWRFRDFSVTEFSRKINLGESSRRSKIAIFGISGAQNFVLGTFLPSKSVNIHENQISEPLNV